MMITLIPMLKAAVIIMTLDFSYSLKGGLRKDEGFLNLFLQTTIMFTITTTKVL